jgi:hypothetical protein
MNGFYVHSILTHTHTYIYMSLTPIYIYTFYGSRPIHVEWARPSRVCVLDELSVRFWIENPSIKYMVSLVRVRESWASIRTWQQITWASGGALNHWVFFRGRIVGNATNANAIVQSIQFLGLLLTLHRNVLGLNALVFKRSGLASTLPERHRPPNVAKGHDHNMCFPLSPMWTAPIKPTRWRRSLDQSYYRCNRKSRPICDRMRSREHETWHAIRPHRAIASTLALSHLPKKSIARRINVSVGWLAHRLVPPTVSDDYDRGKRKAPCPSGDSCDEGTIEMFFSAESTMINCWIWERQSKICSREGSPIGNFKSSITKNIAF